MNREKVLVIGGGGREHALCWALRRSPRVGEVVCAPGNGGIASLARCIPVDASDLDVMVQVASSEQPGLTVIGPEVPLALGLADALQARGLRVFGPTRAAAALESSKAFAKRFMQRHAIPTAEYAVCASVGEAREALELFAGRPVVVKADGLHAGKGVLICPNHRDAEQAAAGLLTGALLGTPSPVIVIEEKLEGEELSFLLMTDGVHIAPLPFAQDHKRIGDGDTGLNTGGMGAYSTDSMLAPAMRDWLLRHIAQPTVDGMSAESTPFVGVLFIGLMMTARGPVVLEYNTRFGDPETQALLMRLDSDLFEAMEAAVEGRLSDTELRWRPGASACVVAAAEGYPGKPRAGDTITGLAEAKTLDGIQVFHAGTVRIDGDYRTAGGRILNVCAAAEALPQALAQAYNALGRIHFEGMQYRRDIGRRALHMERT